MYWLDKYPIANDEHKLDLERDSAMYTITYGMSKDQAESLAYQKYKKKQHVKAAAYHLDGMDSAKARGSIEDANRHYSMFCLHSQQLGLRPHDPVNAEVEAHKQKVYARVFQPHESDCLVLSK